MKISFIEFQVSPRPYIHVMDFKLEPSPTQFEEIRKVLLMNWTATSLNEIPASSMLESVFIMEIASSLEGASAIKSSM
ncbi:hypothetical protein TNCV_624761 [Trichonephila clavipes]|nr:hypothetical protein TNCV_624761 [Trichonephila clavipes]